MVRLRIRGAFWFPRGRWHDKLAGMGRSLVASAGIEEGRRDDVDGDSGVESMVRGNPLPMWICDRETKRFLEVSRGAVREYGYAREEFLAMTAEQLRAADADAMARPCRSAASGRTTA